LAEYIPNTTEETKQMLAAIGVSSIEDLFQDIKDIHKPKQFNIPKGLSEIEVTSHIKKIARKNKHNLTIFAGAGYYVFD